MKQVVNYSMEVDALRVALHEFWKDYVPAILSFITPAKIPGKKPVLFRPYGHYSDDQLGLSGDFYISKVAKPRKQNRQYELRCVFASRTSDVVIGRFSDALTAALVSFCCGVRTSKLFYLDNRVNHKIPYLWDFARIHRLSIFAPYFMEESCFLYRISVRSANNLRRFFLKPQRIGEFLDTVQTYPPAVVTGASHVEHFYRMTERERGYEMPTKDSDLGIIGLEQIPDFLRILEMYYNYPQGCAVSDKDRDDSMRKACGCYNRIRPGF
jgi:hypothetical protein